MDGDETELINRLFAAATAMFEDAIEIAGAGHSSRLDRKTLGPLGSRLGVAAQEIATIAEAVTILADLPDDRC